MNLLKRESRSALLCGAILLGWSAICGAAQPADSRATENVILLMTDGLRWQEVFAGAEESLLTKEPGGVKDVEGLKAEFWRNTPEERRAALLPFLWGTVGKQGQIFGNRNKGSHAQVTNGMHFSYPGYNETLCGFADPRIDSNDKVPNPNVTVFEWLNRQDAYHGKVAAFGVWDCFPYIFNRDRCGFLINSGFEPLPGGDKNPRIALLNELKTGTTAYFGAEPFDAFEIESAIEYIKDKRPRVFFLSLNETDAWGHGGRYDLYLKAAHAADDCLRRLWETVQAIPQYQGKTSILVTVDHGRGDAPVDWKSHGEKIAKSEYIWAAAIGPDTPALGERENSTPITQSQIAATVAALLGEDFCAAVPQAAKPITDVLPK
jgi:hypothetical protein